jgi:hypothetical protein
VAEGKSKHVGLAQQKQKWLKENQNMLVWLSKNKSG